MSHYVLSELAQADLVELTEYIAADDVEAAFRVGQDIKAAMERLSEMPNLGHLRTDLADGHFRIWPVHSYLIIYRSTTTPIEIARILSGFRDIPGLLS